MRLDPVADLAPPAKSVVTLAVVSMGEASGCASCGSPARCRTSSSTARHGRCRGRWRAWAMRRPTTNVPSSRVEERPVVIEERAGAEQRLEAFGRIVHRVQAAAPPALLGTDVDLAEPGLEAQAALVQQHAEPVDAAIAARRGRRRAGRSRAACRRCRRPPRSCGSWREIDVERRLAGHAERGGVDQQGRAVERLARGRPSARPRSAVRRSA